ncbi:hypothetical protein BSKO_00534 [Bryopsis sp. KO-2023]|nr:hypothetical protein BSKO_00534 [Bryopsis sp. KO-2023]
MDVCGAGDSPSVEFSSKDYMPLYISPVSLQKALKTTVGMGQSSRTERHCIAHLKVGAEMDVLELIVETNRKIRKSTTFYISLLEPLGGDDICQLDPSDFSFKVEAYTGIPSIFEEVISQLTASECDEVCISFQKDRLIFDAASNGNRDSRARIVLERDDENLQIRGEKKPCQASFRIKFLNRCSDIHMQKCTFTVFMGQSNQSQNHACWCYWEEASRRFNQGFFVPCFEIWCTAWYLSGE